MVTKAKIKCCPIEAAFEYFGKKWVVHIIRDMLRGKRRFRDFLEANPKLSTRILSLRLRELEEDGLIEKQIISTTPLKAEYRLTEKGRSFDKVLVEMALYSFRNMPEKVLGKTKCDMQKMAELTRKELCSCK